MSSRVTFSSPHSNASSKAASLSAQRVPSFLRSRSPSVSVTKTKVDESCTPGKITWCAIFRSEGWLVTFGDVLVVEFAFGVDASGEVFGAGATAPGHHHSAAVAIAGRLVCGQV